MLFAGPFCSDVVRRPGCHRDQGGASREPDYARTFPPFVGNDDEQLSAFFTQFNRNKRGITLNLKSDDGKALLKKLVQKADILVENFRPGTMDKLGLSYEVLREINPGSSTPLLVASGRTGPNFIQAGL